LLLLLSCLSLLAFARRCFFNGDLCFGCLPVSTCPLPSPPFCELLAVRPGPAARVEGIRAFCSCILWVWLTSRQALPGAQSCLVRAVGAFLFCCYSCLVLFSLLVLAPAFSTVTSGLVVCRFQPARSLPSHSASCWHSGQASRHAWKAFVPHGLCILLVWPTSRQALPCAQKVSC